MANLISIGMNSKTKENPMQFLVPDMICGSCVPHVTDAIAKVDPGAEIEADTVARTITVSTSASQQEIEEALADDGYPATAI